MRKWVIEILTGQEQCIKLFVLTVGKNVKCHSSPLREGQSTVENATENVDRQEEATEDIRIIVSDVSEVIPTISNLASYLMEAR